MGVIIIVHHVGMHLVLFLFVYFLFYNYHPYLFIQCQLLPCVHAQGVKQSICVVGMKIARYRVLGICVCCKHNESVDIYVSVHFKLLDMAR